MLPAMRRLRKKRATGKKQKKFIGFISILIVFLIAAVGFVSLYHPKSYATTINDVSAKSLGEDTAVSCNQSNVITHGSRTNKKIALTFDADMTFWMDSQLKSRAVKSYIDRQLISLLEATKTPATFFLTGLWVEDYPLDTENLAHNALFELANHSYSHPSFSGYCYGLPQLGELSMQQEIDKTQQLLKNYTGADNKYFRFPGGCVSTDAMNYLSSKGMQVVHWDVVGDDGFNDNTKTIVHNVIDHVQNGSIIVMHMNGYPNDPSTADALPIIVAELKTKGYEFVKVSELLTE